MAARLVCETKSTIAIYAPAEPVDTAGPGPLIITFPHLTFRPKGVHFWQDAHLQRANVSAIGLVAKQPHWFTRLEMSLLLPALLPIIARHRPGRIVTLGYSMGATGALMHGHVLGADLSAALSPHYSIDPAIIGGFDQRPKRTFDPAQHVGFKIEADDLAPVPVLFYDPLHACDREHARRIEALSKRVLRVMTTGSGHFSMPTLATTDLGAQRFIELLVRGPREGFLRTARNLVRAQRDHSADYHQELSAALLAHRRGELALRSATRAVELQPRNARHKIFLADLRESLRASLAPRPGPAATSFAR